MSMVRAELGSTKVTISNHFDEAFVELSEAVKLDKHDLDNQLIDHAELYRQVCDYLALYTAQRDRAEAEADQEIRQDAADAGEKITEAAIKQRLVLNDGLAKLNLTVARLQVLKDSYIERRHAFGKLADLYGSQYWSEHSGVARGSKAVQSARRERISETIGRNNRER
jgi:hypothetical protein